MTDDPAPNALLPLGELRSTQAGDLPERLRARYFTEDHGREWRLYSDATLHQPTIEDRGRRLISRNADPNAVRDMLGIAQHRGWRTLEARGVPAFRREAWLQGRALGLDVRGYRPTERDLQALDRLTARRAQKDPDRHTPPPGPTAPGPADRLRLAEAVIRTRVPDPARQAGLLAAARARLADWLDRGARFDPIPALHERAPRHAERRRQR